MPAISLIDQLTKFGHLTPDQIVSALTVPFPRWRRLGMFTLQEYDLNRQQVIVLYNSRERQYFRGQRTCFVDRSPRPMQHWGALTFTSDSNLHWFCMSAEVAYPFEHGVHDVEADRGA